MRNLLALAFVAGCGSEVDLLGVPGGDGPEGTVSLGVNDPNNNNNGGGNGGSGIWGDLRPGSLPEVYFAVAYSTASWGTWYDADADSDEMYWYPPDVKYAVIDLRGQVVWEPELPYESYSYQHLDLAPAGPGQFTALLQPWYYTGSEDADGIWMGSNWESWQLDARALTEARTAHWNWETYAAHIDAAAVDVDLGDTNSYLHIGTFPNSPESALFLPSDANSCAGTVRDLQSVHLTDPNVLPQAFPASSFVPADLAAEPTWAWGFSAGANDAGEPLALIGMTPWDCYAVTGSPRVIAWSPDAGIRWQATLGADTWPLEATFDPREGGGALHLGWNETTTEQVWRVSNTFGTTQGPLGTERYDVRPGPVLEQTSNTFMTVGRRPEDSWDDLRIWHRGEVVWTIDDLKFGMSHVPVQILDIVAIPN